MQVLLPPDDKTPEQARGEGGETLARGGSGSVVWEVPVGRGEDASLVRWVTVLVTLCGTLVCLWQTLGVEPSSSYTRALPEKSYGWTTPENTREEGREHPMLEDEGRGRGLATEVRRREGGGKGAGVSGRYGRGKSPGF